MLLLYFVLLALSSSDPLQYLKPQVHFTPHDTYNAGLGDIAGAVSVKGHVHVHQLLANGNSNNSGINGWNHAVSTDFVHFKNLGVVVNDWPSGFSIFDQPNDEICFGMRTDSVPSPNGSPEDSTLTLRCAPVPEDQFDPKGYNLSSPEVMFPVYNWRFAPYDPFTPILTSDGYWNVGVAFDGCNNSHTYGDEIPDPPCGVGGGFRTWRSKDLRSTSTTSADWELVPGYTFLSNKTVFGTDTEGHEFVTIDFFTPPLSSDDLTDPNSIDHDFKVLLNNPYYARGSTEVYLGTMSRESFDGKFEYFAHSMLDWGEFRPRDDGCGSGISALNATKPNLPDGGRMGMTRTAAGENGRRVAYGAVWGHYTATSIGRDLSFSRDEGLLLQQFVPELKSLRKEGSHVNINEKNVGEHGGVGKVKGRQLELVARFSHWEDAKETFGLKVLMDKELGEWCEISYNPKNELICIDATRENEINETRCGSLVVREKGILQMHVVVDGTFVVVIANNVTAITSGGVPSESSVDVAVFGEKDLKFSVDIWELDSAEIVI